MITDWLFHIFIIFRLNLQVSLFFHTLTCVFMILGSSLLVRSHVRANVCNFWVFSSFPHYRNTFLITATFHPSQLFSQHFTGKSRARKESGRCRHLFPIPFSVIFFWLTLIIVWSRVQLIKKTILIKIRKPETNKLSLFPSLGRFF